MGYGLHPLSPVTLVAYIPLFRSHHAFHYAGIIMMLATIALEILGLHVLTLECVLKYSYMFIHARANEPPKAAKERATTMVYLVALHAIEIQIQV